MFIDSLARTTEQMCCVEESHCHNHTLLSTRTLISICHLVTLKCLDIRLPLCHSFSADEEETLSQAIFNMPALTRLSITDFSNLDVMDVINEPLYNRFVQHFLISVYANYVFHSWRVLPSLPCGPVAWYYLQAPSSSYRTR